MNQNRILNLELDISDTDAWALAQFVKRVGWQEIRANAVDEQEAYRIQGGVASLQAALARQGLAPR